MIPILFIIAIIFFSWLYWHLRKKSAAHPHEDEDINLPMLSEDTNLPANHHDVWPPPTPPNL